MFLVFCPYGHMGYIADYNQKTCCRHDIVIIPKLMALFMLLDLSYLIPFGEVCEQVLHDVSKLFYNTSLAFSCGGTTLKILLY